MVDASEDYEGIGKSVEITNLNEREFVAGLHTLLLRGNLSDMDAEISALEARREKTRRVKQGMMQELLTGRTQVEVPLPDRPSPLRFGVGDLPHGTGIQEDYASHLRRGLSEGSAVRRPAGIELLLELLP